MRTITGPGRRPGAAMPTLRDRAHPALGLGRALRAGALCVCLAQAGGLLGAGEDSNAAPEGPEADFVMVPAGAAQFVDFSDKVYERDVPEFWISRHEITNDVYDFFLKHAGSDPALRHPKEPRGASYRPLVTTSEANAPVCGVSWFAACAFCKWSGAALPSYEEWCKAGFWDPEARRRTVLPWGDAGDVPFNRLKTKPVPITSFPKDVSYYGVRNMAGGPVEWIDKWDGEGFTVAMGYYFRGDKGQSFNINSTHEECGFRVVLRGLKLAELLSEADKKSFSDLLTKLGAERFADREDAQRQLVAAGALARPVLAEHADSPDPEIRLRVRTILAQKLVLKMRLDVDRMPEGRSRAKWVPAERSNPRQDAPANAPK